MTSAYDLVLDAAIQQLQELKDRGTRFVAVAPETVAALKQPARAAPTPGSATRVEPARTRPVQPAARPASTPPKAAAQPSVTEAGLDLALPGVTAPAQAAAALGPEGKAAAFADLRQRAMACMKCEHLASSRRTVVFGVGNIEAELMFVGEAPGADEDQQGEPFVGAAGQLLTRIIQAMGLTRDTVYIANILKCRPDTPGQSSGNRKPTPEEMQTCIPFLHEQIDLIRPKVLVALGGTAVEGLLGKTIGITRLRGTWKVYRGIPLMPTYHPAYLLRNQSPMEKRRVWEDMLKVMEKLDLPISEKQRNYFLKG
ncbi:MAG TPA: uracil-DNA glycosylase family protein [Candidatus Acidoferrum sp.]|nr:uracil-DNA glycosylase family protein [Candidatus Acidoferrum sp.]